MTLHQCNTGSNTATQGKRQNPIKPGLLNGCSGPKTGLNMSSKYKVKQVKCTVFVEKHCDICGAKSNDIDNWDSDKNYSSETEITLSEGTTCPDGNGDFQTTFECDICPECFKQKLIPWLESQGVSPKGTDVEIME